jgi:small subunit ribosomal protein S8
MTNNDPLSSCLSKVNNAGKVSKNTVTINCVSKMIKKVLDIFQKHEYLDNFEVEEKKRAGKIVITLNNTINKCGAIKPRYKVQVTDIERFEQRYLPAKGFGLLIISTSKGLLTNTEAKEKNVGGRLIAYCY